MNIRYPIYEGVYRILTFFFAIYFCFNWFITICAMLQSFSHVRPDEAVAGS